MTVLYIALYVVAAVCFVFAGRGATGSLRLAALGLLAWELIPLIYAIRRHD